jgi:Zn-dependent protease with chaperone function
MDRNHKTMMVEDFVAAFAKAARVSDVPEEAITSDTHAPSYMFLAAEWNRSTVSERAYLLAMLFRREFEVEADDFSLQIAGSAMMMAEPDGSPALIARVDLAAADDGGTPTGAVD